MRSVLGADYQNLPRPIGILIAEYPAGNYDPPHLHPRAQMIYATDGVISVMTEEASFTIPPQRAVWVPAGVRHEAISKSHVSLKTLYIRPDAHPGLPTRAQVLKVSPLLRELIVEASGMELEYDEAGREGRLMGLILDEIVESARRAAVALQIRMPATARLVKVCRDVMREPAREADLGACADAAGMSRRTFTRAFRAETGMSFNAWHQQVRLAEALSLLSQGQSVTTAAFDVGYNSASAFTAMFRRTFGVAPRGYFAEA